MQPDQNSYEYALSSNQAWAGYKAHQNPSFFKNLAASQNPSILWMGCSDSQVPETIILGLQPGDVFVHRNIGSVISPTDINTSAVIEFAVQHLQVKHIVLCGHSCCTGAQLALQDSRAGGVLDTWLTSLKALCLQYEDELNSIYDSNARAAKVAELNVEAGVKTVMGNWAVQEAVRSRGLTVHGCFFDVASGRVRDMGVGTKGRGKNEHANTNVVRGNHGVLVFSDGNSAAMAIR